MSLPRIVTRAHNEIIKVDQGGGGDSARCDYGRTLTTFFFNIKANGTKLGDVF